MHKSFKPKMVGGEMSPEAHKEWEDKDGKHEINGGHKEASPSLQGKGEKLGFGGLGPSKAGASMGAHESRDIAKGKGGKEKALFPQVKNSSGFKTGPMRHAGADEGRIKADGGIRSDTPMAKPSPDLKDSLGKYAGKKR